MPPGRRPSDDGLPPNDLAVVRFNPLAGKTIGLLLCILFLLIGVSNAVAKRGPMGDTFTRDRLLSDPVWNQSGGYVEFKVMAYDAYGNEMDDYLASAKLFIGDQFVGYIGNDVGHNYENVRFAAVGE
ncbi:MAG: hypothetical protein LBU22_00730, partial [Dysgonamonadaceae bacterium]|nr:hypothetical protein [Dysgonamonadaceae bacterium]